MVSEDDCIAALRRAAEELGESPTKAAYENLGLTPASATIQRVLGSWNGAKQAAGLETNPSTGSRVGPKPEDVELPEGVEWEALSQDQRWVRRHSEENNRRTRERRAELRRWLRTYKLEHGGCAECGESDPRCLDFHHPEEVDKDVAVNEMVPLGYARADVEQEAERCTLLCANRHQTPHRERPPPADGGWTDVVTEGDADRRIRPEDVDLDGTLAKRERLRRWSLLVRWRYGCGEFGEPDPACLDFHHPEGIKKTGTVS